MDPETGLIVAQFKEDVAAFASRVGDTRVEGAPMVVGVENFKNYLTTPPAGDVGGWLLHMASLGFLMTGSLGVEFREDLRDHLTRDAVGLRECGYRLGAAIPGSDICGSLRAWAGRHEHPITVEVTDAADRLVAWWHDIDLDSLSVRSFKWAWRLLCDNRVKEAGELYYIYAATVWPYRHDSGSTGQRQRLACAIL